MRRYLLLFLVLLTLLFASGCTTTTHHMLAPVVLDPDLSLDEKLSSYSIPKVNITFPKVYYDGLAWRDRVLELVEGAEDYLITSAFLASSAEDLQMLYEALARKAESGVRVYFVVDGIGPFDMTETRFHLIPLKFLRESGVHLLEFNPISSARLVSLFSLLDRDHRKYLIVDGKQLAMGGMNLNYISIGAMDDNLQRDSMYEFYSPELCSLLLDAFVPWWNEQSWEEVRREDFQVDASVALGMKTYEAWYVDQHPGSEKVSALFGTMLAEAQHEVKVLPFLPFMDANMIEAFRTASDRGVDVQMIIPFDKRVTNRKGIEYMVKDLRKMQIDLRIEKESAESQRLLHEKLMIVDDRYVVIGSTNMNFRSFNLAYETSLVIDSEELAREVEKHFDELYKKTVPITEAMAEAWQTFANWPRFAVGFFGG
ncbi:MAG: phosphatidylserine/phosphatidylglycerophosphate/cardiolipin synthase family protein [Sphaerochaeta sp.]|nr:phosphatidylserine/phosphatidylglycerophosphate/cardiolipin synthase family protein [Sphaerochaeta sp.]MDD3929131.1 phosphatidylserine/phosphatidylglycerophosphate/cardiolipin synthase family protein [Sphaerochaeta sp.]